MRRAFLPLLLLAAALVTGPAMAKVLAEGKPSPGGFYWQKVEKSNGSVQYLCRKTSDSKIQKAAACNGAKATDTTGRQQLFRPQLPAGYSGAVVLAGASPSP